jgi:dTDP-glucose 4,6-dehydratase
MAETMLVTGGCGFIGSCFVLQQMQQYPNLRLINVDKLTYAGNPDNVKEVAGDPRYTFVQADVADRPAVEAVFAQYHPTQVVHFAAESHVDRSIDGPDVFVRTNVLGTQVLLDVARKQWQEDGCMDTARFLYISTDEVYGDLPIESTEKFTESSPIKPSSPYSVSKAAGDLMAQAYHRTYGMPTLITFVPDRSGHDRRYALDVAKTRSGFEWDRTTDTRTAMRRTVVYCCENSQKWRSAERSLVRPPIESTRDGA